LRRQFSKLFACHCITITVQDKRMVTMDSL